MGLIYPHSPLPSRRSAALLRRGPHLGDWGGGNGGKCFGSHRTMPPLFRTGLCRLCFAQDYVWLARMHRAFARNPVQSVNGEPGSFRVCLTGSDVGLFVPELIQTYWLAIRFWEMRFGSDTGLGGRPPTHPGSRSENHQHRQRQWLSCARPGLTPSLVFC